MNATKAAFAGFLTLASVMGFFMGCAGINRLKDFNFIPFYSPPPNTFVHVLGIFPFPPNGLILAWDRARIVFGLASLLVPLACIFLLIARERPVRGWLLLAITCLFFAFGGMWIWFDAALNAAPMQRQAGQ